MLVLSGKEDDRFFIGDHPVQIVSVCRRTGKVRLGFDFPGEVAVDRETVRKRKLAEAQELDELTEVTRQAF